MLIDWCRNQRVLVQQCARLGVDVRRLPRRPAIAEIDVAFRAVDPSAHGGLPCRRRRATCAGDRPGVGEEACAQRSPSPVASRSTIALCSSAKMRDRHRCEQVAAAEEGELFDQLAIGVAQGAVAGHLDDLVVKPRVEHMEAVDVPVAAAAYMRSVMARSAASCAGVIRLASAGPPWHRGRPAPRSRSRRPRRARSRARRRHGSSPGGSAPTPRASGRPSRSDRARRRGARRVPLGPAWHRGELAREDQLLHRLGNQSVSEVLCTRSGRYRSGRRAGRTFRAGGGGRSRQCDDFLDCGLSTICNLPHLSCWQSSRAA